MGIIYTATALFGMTTLMGLYLSALVLLNKKSSKPVIVIHGVFTITGFVLLLYCYPESLKSILLFSIATLFGVTLLYQDLTHKKFTKWLCYAHAIFTLAGCFFLVVLASSQKG